MSDVCFIFEFSSSQLEVDIEWPEYYVNIEPTKKAIPEYPHQNINAQLSHQLHEPITESSKWLTHLRQALESEVTQRIGWSALYSNSSNESEKPKSLSVLMPLINESINSHAMVRHCMNVISKVVKYVSFE